MAISFASFPNKPLFYLRIAQLAMAVIVLGLSAATISNSTYRYRGVRYSYSSGTDNYSVFVAVWTLLAIPYLLLSPLIFEIAAYPLAFMIVELLSDVFWFAGWIALAAQWGPVGNCFSSSACKTGKASTAMSAITWLLFVASTIVVMTSAVVYFKNKGLSTVKPGIPGGELPVPPVSNTENQHGNEIVDLEASPSTKESVSHNTIGESEFRVQNNDIPPAGTVLNKTS